MAVNKVIYDGETLIDISGDTVTAETLAQGATAHNSRGEKITGNMSAGENRLNLLARRTITNVTAEDLQGVTVLPQNIFIQCYSLVSVDLPEGITRLMNSCFSYCTALTSVVIPESVIELRASVFAYCYGLAEVTFKGTPNSMTASVFNGCSSLTTINVPWAEGAVANAPWGATQATINYNYKGE